MAKAKAQKKALQQDEKNWHTLSSEKIVEELDTRITGITEYEAKIRLHKYGPNEIREGKKKPAWVSLAEQFKSFLILILIIAVIVAAFLGEILDAAVILAIIIINAILGFYQERKAERALEALKKMAVPNATVIRNKEIKVVSSINLVPGDIVVLKAGDKVPADCRIIEQLNLKTDESLLTGESVPVVKTEKTLIDEELHVSDRKNMLFAGTIVVYGHCKAVIVETGMNTEFGKIASALEAPEEKTPLQNTLDKLGVQLGIIFVVMCAVIFGLGLLAGMEFFTILLIAISLAVAAVPEGLPAAVTIALALGVQRMAKENSIIRRLSSVETLGCTTIICTDKTGTLTMNQMTVKKIWIDGRTIDVTGDGYATSGKFMLDNRAVNVKKHDDLQLILGAGVLCNDAVFEEQIDAEGVRQRGDDAKILGDPTEAALLVVAKKAGLEDLRNEYQRIDEVEFDSERKMMSVVCQIGKKRMMYTKGALEEVLKKCTHIYSNGRARKIAIQDIKQIVDTNRQFTQKAFRVLAFAFKKIGDEKAKENELVFLGLQCMIDPPRPEAKQALELCKKAGIRVVMITGDHKDTATAIAHELGIIDDQTSEPSVRQLVDSQVVTGVDIDRMDDEELNDIVEKVAVYARVSPDHKLRICDTLMKKGHVVAMTGDGINDAPALKKADIGVAMGRVGTDVAREASDMTLTDDNFATIVSAVKEGRGIYDNIKETLMFLLSGNIAELLIIFVVMLANIFFFANTFPLPLIAIQILLINLVMDGLPALAIAADPIDEDVMNKTPRPRSETLFSGSRRYLLDFPIITTILVLGLFFWSFQIAAVGDVIKAQTIVFVAVIVFRKYTAFSCLNIEKPMIKNIFRNKFLNVVTVITIALLLLIIYVPAFNEIFHTTPLNAVDWLLIIGAGAIAFIYLETAKMLKSRATKNDANNGSQNYQELEEQNNFVDETEDKFDEKEYENTRKS